MQQCPRVLTALLDYEGEHRNVVFSQKVSFRVRRIYADSACYLYLDFVQSGKMASR